MNSLFFILEWKDLDSDVKALIFRSKAPSTWKKYNATLLSALQHNMSSMQLRQYFLCHMSIYVQPPCNNIQFKIMPMIILTIFSRPSHRAKSVDKATVRETVSSHMSLFALPEIYSFIHLIIQGTTHIWLESFFDT